MWKTFNDKAMRPRWIKGTKKPEPLPGKVVVTALAHGWCTGTNGMIERAKRICEEFGEKVVFREIDMSDPENIREWGMSDGLFVDGKNIYKGPPLSYDRIKAIIGKKLKRLNESK